MSSVRSSAAPGGVDISAAMDLLARRPSWLSEAAGLTHRCCGVVPPRFRGGEGSLRISQLRRRSLALEDTSGRYGVSYNLTIEKVGIRQKVAASALKGFCAT